MKWWKFFLRKAGHLKERGLNRSIQSMVSIIEDRSFDRTLSVRTEGKIFLQELGVTSEYLEKDQRPRRYKATRVRAFRKLMGWLALSKEHVFVDVGSGMGRILLLAMEYGFHKVVGVDISSSLCQIARENVAKYQQTHRTNTQVDIIEDDVVVCGVQDDQTVFYLFHPFSAEVLGIFFEKLQASLHRKDREVWVIYNHPVYREVIDDLHFFEETGAFVYGDSTFLIYRHRVSIEHPENEWVSAVSLWAVPQ